MSHKIYEKKTFLQNFLNSLQKYSWYYICKIIFNFFKKLNFINLFKNFIFTVVVIIEDFKRTDFLWVEIRRYFFFKKLRHFFFLLFLSYYTISYGYDVYLQRNTLNDLDRYPETEHIKLTNKEWDLLMFEDLIGHVYWFGYFEISNIRDMWWCVSLYIIFINIFFFFSFFFRSFHDVFYTKRWIIPMLSFSFSFLFMINWCFVEMYFAYLHEKSIFPRFFLHSFTLLIFAFCHWRYEYPEDCLNPWIQRFLLKFKEDELNNNKQVSNEFNNVYNFDLDNEISELNQIKGNFDIDRATLYRKWYAQIFWRYDLTKDFGQNFLDNLKKTTNYIYYDLQGIIFRESFTEYIFRFCKETGIDNPIDSLNYKNRELIILPWNHSDRIKDKSAKELFFFYFWIRENIPLLIRWTYLFVWFYSEYKINKVRIKKNKKKNSQEFKFIFFWKSLKRFFGFKVEDKLFLIKVNEGYIIEKKGSYHTILKNDPLFNFNLYKRAVSGYDAVLIQLYNFFFNLSINVIYFIFNFFGSFNFWISFFLFWQKYSPFRVFFRWVFCDFFWYYFKLLIFSSIKILYRIYKILDIIVYIIYNFFRIIYSWNVLYLCFWLNLLYSFRIAFLIFFRRIRFVGPFRYYNCSPGRKYRVARFWNALYCIFFFFPKMFKVNRKKSFLVWSKKRVNKFYDNNI